MTLKRKDFGGLFFFIIQNSLHLKELKYCIGWVFWRVYLNPLNLIYVIILLFFSTKCCFNVLKKNYHFKKKFLKLKNLLITNINLWFSKKYSFKKYKCFSIFLHISHPPKLFLPFQTLNITISTVAHTLLIEGCHVVWHVSYPTSALVIIL